MAALTAAPSIFIGLGANMQQPCEQLQAALNCIANDPAIQLVAISPIYRSAAYGVTDQDDFFNAVIGINTRYSALALLHKLLEIEQLLGRKRIQHWGPRCIDLDLLCYQQQRWATQRLQLPHPGIALRRFVLLPLRDIAPNFSLQGQSIHHLIQQCEPQQLEKLSTQALQWQPPVIG